MRWCARIGAQGADGVEQFSAMPDDRDAERLPEDLTGRQCYVLDPMLATGGTLGSAVQFLVQRGADDITCICLIAAPEGIARLTELVQELHITCTLVLAGLDEKLNDVGYILPGLGDAGDRLYGVV